MGIRCLGAQVGHEYCIGAYHWLCHRCWVVTREGLADADYAGVLSPPSHYVEAGQSMMWSREGTIAEHMSTVIEDLVMLSY